MVATVQFDGVGKAFGKTVVCRNLNLEIERGEVLTILGGSGSGKSVMLKMILGLLAPDEGRILVDGEDITGYGDAQLLPIRRKVGMLFQHGALFDSLSVFDNVAYPVRERGLAGSEEIAGIVERCLEMVGLPGIAQQMPAELSGGMRKRVALARAISARPAVVLYDEPTTGLDPNNVRRISDLIVGLSRDLELTSVVVTHDLSSTFLISDRIAMLARRHIVEVAPAAEFRHSSVPEVREFLSAMPDAGGQTWLGT